MSGTLALLFLASAAAPPSTDERFTVGPEEMSGPCHVKIQGKPVETPPTDCQAAIEAATTPKNKAILYFAWAYSLNEKDAAIQALPNLDKAVALAPNFSNARHERSYTLNDLGFYDRALVDGNVAVELSPKSPMVYQDRAFARHALADFEGALADRLKVVELAGPEQNNQVAIVDELIWLGRYDQAAKRLEALPESDGVSGLRADVDRRRRFKPDGSEAKRCALEKSADDRAAAQKMVDDCTWAFDHEADRAKRADYLTVRAINSVVTRQDRNASPPDLQIAAALDPKDPNRHVNLGFAYLGVEHSWAARNAFEIALATPNLDKKTKMLALAGRGQARANLGDLVGAFGDGKASFEIEPMEANTFLLGDLLFEKGDKAGAKKFWMATYHLGGRDDSLIEKLRSVGVENPDKEPR